MATRKQRGSPVKPDPKLSESGLGLARERHTGEGSASALATLQRMERERAGHGAEPDDGISSDAKH